MNTSLATTLILILFLELSLVKSQNPQVPALYVFGDSLSDSGNNNNLPTDAKANYPPYGVDFYAGPTGRFTNGKTFVDFTAEKLGLPYIPAYRSLSAEQRAQATNGLNYASGSAGILDVTGKRLGTCVPLKLQIDEFEETVKVDLPNKLKGQELSDHLSKSIFLVSIGSNDYINNFLQPDYYYKTTERPAAGSFADHLIQHLQKHIERLYNLGARKIVMFDIGPIGCIPNNTNSQLNKRECVAEINNFVIEYNNQLANLIKKLSSTMEGSKFVRGETYKLSEEIYNNPSKYGFSYTNVPCCVTFGGGIGPCKPQEPPCEDRSKHIYWDSYHPVEAVNSLVSKSCCSDSPSICSPMNIQQLALA